MALMKDGAQGAVHSVASDSTESGPEPAPAASTCSTEDNTCGTACYTDVTGVGEFYGIYTATQESQTDPAPGVDAAAQTDMSANCAVAFLVTSGWDESVATVHHHACEAYYRVTGQGRVEELSDLYGNVVKASAHSHDEHVLIQAHDDVESEVEFDYAGYLSKYSYGFWELARRLEEQIQEETVAEANLRNGFPDKTGPTITHEDSGIGKHHDEQDKAKAAMSRNLADVASEEGTIAGMTKEVDACGQAVEDRTQKIEVETVGARVKPQAVKDRDMATEAEMSETTLTAETGKTVMTSTETGKTVMTKEDDLCVAKSGPHEELMATYEEQKGLEQEVNMAPPTSSDEEDEVLTGDEQCKRIGNQLLVILHSSPDLRTADTTRAAKKVRRLLNADVCGDRLLHSVNRLVECMRQS